MLLLQWLLVILTAIQGAIVNYLYQFAIHEYQADQTLTRQSDPETGLMLWPA
jgi:hypothetical protein